MVEDVGLYQAFRTEVGQLFPGYKELFWERAPGCNMVLENASGLRKYIEFKGGNPSAAGRWLEKKQYQLAKEKRDDFVIVRWKDASRSGIKLAVGLGKGFEITMTETKYLFRFR
ncbi:MAG: hypothetical protein Q8O86_02475 [Dehalococcoidia bacterium]|nr:hypothetical protein [Dehalococcoidia bacterium]